MKDRYNKFVFVDERGITFQASAEEGITFEVSEEAGEVSKIRACNKATDETPKEAGEVSKIRACNKATDETPKETGHNSNIKVQNIATSFSYLPAVSAGEYAERLSVYTDKNGNNAVIPPGWTVSGVKKENTVWGKNVSVVIYRIPKKKVENINWTDEETVELLKRTYSQLVWCPVSMLDSDGTLDGKKFNKKFGRRNFKRYGSSEEIKFHEEANLEMRDSVNLYGGFYISRYHISKSGTSGESQSVKGVKPWTDISYPDARIKASTFEVNEVVKGVITSGAGFDSVLSWLKKTGTKSDKEISEFGYSTNEKGNWTDKDIEKMVVAYTTGREKKYSSNNIYDINGLLTEWTSEESTVKEWTPKVRWCSYGVIRSGTAYLDFDNHPYTCPIATRSIFSFDDCFYRIGFRVMLYIVVHH